MVATVIWEDTNQSDTDVYFETDAEFADSLTGNPHAFLVGCLIPTNASHGWLCQSRADNCGAGSKAG